MLAGFKNKKKILLVFVVLIELFVGFHFLYDFYQKRIVYKLPDSDKVAVIEKKNLIFPKDSEYKYYYTLEPNTISTDSPDWLTYEAKYNINADGLNDRFDYSVEKPASTFRIVALGDSFTYGHFVNTEDSWPEQLEDMLNQSNDLSKKYHFEVLNLGMQGWDIPYIVKRYKDIGSKYNPDLIIWFESGSGFVRLNELMSEKINSCETDDKIVDFLDFKNKTYYCWYIAQKDIDDKYPYEEIEKITTGHLDNFFSLVDQKKTLFFTFESSNLKDDWKKTLEKWSARYPDAVFFSNVPIIYNLKQVLPDGHPSKEGHTTIASSIYEYLENYFLINGL